MSARVAIIITAAPKPAPAIVGQEVPEDGREGAAVPVALGVLVGAKVGVAVAVGEAVGVGLAVGEDVAAETVKLRAVQVWGVTPAAFGLVGAEGATGCCLNW